MMTSTTTAAQRQDHGAVGVADLDGQDFGVVSNPDRNEHDCAMSAVAAMSAGRRPPLQRRHVRQNKRQLPRPAREEETFPPSECVDIRTSSLSHLNSS